MNSSIALSQASEATFEVPTITLLGSLDDSQGTTNLGLAGANSNPVFAIIYNPI